MKILGFNYDVIQIQDTLNLDEHNIKLNNVIIFFINGGDNSEAVYSELKNNTWGNFNIVINGSLINTIIGPTKFDSVDFIDPDKKTIMASIYIGG